MSNSKAKPGTIVWHDLTVKNATEVKEFYKQVVGWDSTDHDMGGYNDYNINLPGTGDTVAGICHARGSNANLPAQWLTYVQVDDVNECAEKCKQLGGTILDGPRKMAGSNFCVIKDPAGAVLALID